MDIFCIKGVAPHFFVSAVNQQLPAGMTVDKVHPIAFDLPSLQSQVSQAEYTVQVDTNNGPENIKQALNDLLALEHLPWQHLRDTGPKQYDLRILIHDLWLIDWNPPAGLLGMRLQCDSNGSGRPEQVASALGFTQRPPSIHRTQLILKSR